MTAWVRPDLAPGQYPNGAQMEILLDQIDTLESAWVSGAPTWTASAGTPAIGDGTLAGRYLDLGKTRVFRWQMTAGGTTTFGTAGALFFWTIPGGGTANGTQMGSGWFYDTSSGNNYPCTWKIDTGATQMRMWRNDASPATELLNNAPVAMATGDLIMCSGVIEVT